MTKSMKYFLACCIIGCAVCMFTACVDNDDDVQIVGGDIDNGDIADLGGGEDDIYMIDIDNETTPGIDDGGLIADNSIGVGEDGMPDYANDVPGDILV